MSSKHASYLPTILYGGDYNPDQWPRELWQEDMRLFKAANVTIATLPVFSWAKLQPAEDRYEFGWLDEVLDLLEAQNIRICLATSTAAHPAWMAKRYPEVLRTDFAGRHRKYGQRHNSCPNSEIYRKYAATLAAKIAERYHRRNSLIAWHVSNEFGGYCYCDRCASAFREWLRERYGTIDELNERWSTGFWGHTIYDWDEVVPPNLLSEHSDPSDPTRTAFQPISLDYNRFMSDSLLDCYRIERDAIRTFSESVPVTTNFMWGYKELNYRTWADEIDIISWDSYPSNRNHPSEPAFMHDLMCGLKGGAPFMLMEQTPSQVNWQDYNALKRPGVMRLQSYQAIAHGADSAMFFQLRQSAGSSEKFHGALISHAGHEHTRVFRECADLGAELRKVGPEIAGSRRGARVAILFDWENWWALEYSTGPTRALKYVPQVQKWYRAFWEQNIQVDVISPDDSFDGYTCIIAPTLYMVRPGQAHALERFVESGGTLLATFMSGLVDENDRIRLGGYPGDLRKLLGIWVEEHDPLFPDESNEVVVSEGHGALSGTYNSSLLCEVVHSEGAEVVGSYLHDFYASQPAITRNRHGAGCAWYVATDLDLSGVKSLTRELAASAGIGSPLSVPEGVEVTRRYSEAAVLTFVLNHTREPVRLSLEAMDGSELISGNKATSGAGLELEAFGVAVLKEPLSGSPPQGTS